MVAIFAEVPIMGMSKTMASGLSLAATGSGGRCVTLHIASQLCHAGLYASYTRLDSY